jgi:hypothetical protein
MGAGFAQALFALDAADGQVQSASLIWNGLLQAMLGYVKPGKTLVSADQAICFTARRISTVRRKDSVIVRNAPRGEFRILTTFPEQHSV